MDTTEPKACLDNANVAEEEVEEDLMGLYDDNDVENEGNYSESQNQKQENQLNIQPLQADRLIGSGSGNGKSKDESEEYVEPFTIVTTRTDAGNDTKNLPDINSSVQRSPKQSPKQQEKLALNQTSFDAIVESNQIQSPTPCTKMSSQRKSVSNIANARSSSTANFHLNRPTPQQSTSTTSNEMEALNDEIATLLLTNKITLTTSSKLQSMLRENASLKEKITKLKTLLARSSKVSKETKQELDKAQREVSRLTQRVESLANRPTHMDLLADFETNFDRALMSLHCGNDDPTAATTSGTSQQSGGEDTMPQILPSPSGGEGENVSSLLLSELSQTKARMEHLEALNTQLVQKATKMSKENEQYVSQIERQSLKMSNLQLELRMARMETENATREVKAKAASLSEMQMEIDLVTRSAMNANARAAEGLEVAKSIKSDKAQVEELKAKVAALQEWAVASAEAKEAILEENKLLENRLTQLEKKEVEEDEFRSTTTLRSDNISPKSKGKITERKLWTKTSSLVIGAGMAECRLIELGENEVMDFETVILKWKFDITPNDLDIVFSMLKGRFDSRDKNAMKNAHALIKGRNVVSGGGGEVQGAFVIQNACTLVFSNEHSWVRPRTVKYHVEAFAVV